MKKIIALLLILVLCFSLVACGNDEEPNDNDNNNESSGIQNEDAGSDEKNNHTSDKDLDEPDVEKQPENIVVDAINYSRDVDLSDPQFEYALDLGYKTGDFKHNVVIPKINFTSENVNEFNTKIYNSYKSQYEDIVNHKELRLSDISYTFKYQNGLIGIIITEQGAPIAGGIWDKYQCLYYDLNNDCEISFNEYLSGLGTSYANLWSWLTTTNEYKEFVEWGLDTIVGAVLDNASMDLIVNTPLGFNAEWKFSFEQSVLSNPSAASDF